MEPYSNVYSGGSKQAFEPPKVVQQLHARIDSIIDRLDYMSRRVSRIATAVCGSVPEDGKTGQPFGDHLQDKLSIVEKYISEIENDANRIENSVGEASNPAKEAKKEVSQLAAGNKSFLPSSFIR